MDFFQPLFVFIYRIIEIDVFVANFFLIFREREFITFFLWITLLGEWRIIIGFAIIFSCFLWFWQKKIYLLPLWIVIFGSGSSVFLGKFIFERPRPLFAYYVENSFSFPSGHATFSLAFYGFLLYVLCCCIKEWKYKILILFLGSIIILTIGLSRLYLGVHFLSDVLSGYLLGGLWLIIGITLASFPFSAIVKK